MLQLNRGRLSYKNNWVYLNKRKIWTNWLWVIKEWLYIVKRKNKKERTWNKPRDFWTKPKIIIKIR